MLSFSKTRRRVVYTGMSLNLRSFMNQKQENQKSCWTPLTFGDWSQRDEVLNLSQMLPWCYSEKQIIELIGLLIRLDVAFLIFLGNWADANILIMLTSPMLLSDHSISKKP